VKDGQPKRHIIWNVCDHAETFREVGAQAVSYTTGVPPVVGAMMMFKGAWKGEGVFNVEQLPPEPFLKELGPQGLPWHVRELKTGEQGELFAVKT
jgi:saccharopine dehydrogenase (NAD+, L-lysine-forming)